MKVIDYVLVLLVVFLLGYSVYQKRVLNKNQNKQLSSLLEQVKTIQENVNKIQKNDFSENNPEQITNELKKLSEELNSQIELLGEDVSSKLEKAEEKINFLMEQSKIKKSNECCNTDLKKQVIVKHKEKPVICEKSEVYFQCITKRQETNLKACQQAQLHKTEPDVKTTEIHKSKKISSLTSVDEQITLTRIKNPKNKLIIDNSCFEDLKTTINYCAQLVCRK